MFYYSPDTGELIITSKPSSWMAQTSTAPPDFDPVAFSAVFKDGEWRLVAAVRRPASPISALKFWSALSKNNLRSAAGQYIATTDQSVKDFFSFSTVIDPVDPKVEALMIAIGLDADEQYSFFKAAAKG